MAIDEIIQPWLEERNVDDVEAFVPDMAGSARGKVVPADKFGTTSMRLPESIFQQTVSGDFIDNPNNVEDRDMTLVPDPSTLRPVPWASDPTASIFMDCYRRDGSLVDISPRAVLRSVLAKYESRGWVPIVAPEVEFYLLAPHSDPFEEAKPPEGRLGWTEGARQPFSIDTMNDFDPFINLVYDYCGAQDIRIDTLSQESGPAQFEINFLHGNPVDLADQVFLFKRTVREAAIEHEMHATFLAKPMAKDAGSALHIHQSVIDKQGNNIFSLPSGEPSEYFTGFLGGLQTYLPHAMLVLAPYVNSYRRFLNPLASPVNLAWAVDNRTVGLRVPESGPDSRRVENRLPGADVNPYLAIAVTLACGYLGMVEGLKPDEEAEGSAYDTGEFGLHRHISGAIRAFRASNAMQSMLGQEFVELYCNLKRDEYFEFEEIITPWEREILMFNV